MCPWWAWWACVSWECWRQSCFPRLALHVALRSVAKAVLTVASAARESELRKRVEVAQNRERSARLAMKYEDEVSLSQPHSCLLLSLARLRFFLCFCLLSF